MSRPKSLAERLEWMADNLPGFRDELGFVDQVRHRATLELRAMPSGSCVPEEQVKSVTLTYPDFCLLIGLVAAQVGSDQDANGQWSRFYERLGGSL